MKSRFFREHFAWGGGCIALPLALIGLPVSAEQAQRQPGRQIEEVVVTAEHVESTVSDTSISITAFTSDMLEGFGIRNQEDLQNLIPAAVIEPYDMAVRGVGRNFRSLGGDPGIATYLNGVYSEDFGIASTEGGLFDIERIEVLRGPQGTLYGRNAIGGAVNFINKLPTEEFEGELRSVIGDYTLREYYGVISGPVIPDFMQARFTGTKRTRDAYYDAMSLPNNDDPGNYGDENYALSLRFTPTDSIEINTRTNERSYRRRMGGADAAGILRLDQGGGFTRNTTDYVFGYRAVDPTVMCPDAMTRTATVASPGVTNGIGCTIAGREIFTFTNPQTGALVSAQRKIGGVDGDAEGGPQSEPNHAYGVDPTKQRLIGFDNLESKDLETDGNGKRDEFFDHQANSTDITWTVNDQFTMKYIFGYTDYFYDRTTDTDLTNGIIDSQFYVSQETEYISHELQFFWDPTENLTITSGIFDYDAKISQRGDFFDRNGLSSRYAQDFPYALVGAGAFGALPKVDLFTARASGKRRQNNGPTNPVCVDLGGASIDEFCFGSWKADLGDRIEHGPTSIATLSEYQTRTERSAYAAYSQGVYTFNEHFALTLGARWARDDLDGEENAFGYSETAIAALTLGFPEAGGASSLAQVNQLLGYQGGPLCGLAQPNAACAGAAPGQILDPQRMLVNGIPHTYSIWRNLDRSDEDITWRVNLDWTPNDDTLVYVSATSGFRSGGMNLVFFSDPGKFPAEHLIAYELGYKGALLDSRLQLNSAIYFYDYENVHSFANGVGFLGNQVNVFAAPKAEMIGWDTDFIWLMTDRITLGANFSYTHSEYTDDFFVIDPNDPQKPESLFDPQALPFNIEGNQMLRVPEAKGGAYVQYTWPLSFGNVEFLVNWSWISKVYYSVFEDNRAAAPEYQRTDLRATWTSNDGGWMVAAFVNNVFDEIGIRQIEQYGATEANGWFRTGTATDPRLAGLEVRYKIGAAK
jgi:outer membrane receptor protein involved in Fe transport